MYEGPEFKQLVSFLAIAEECSFSRAAERLHTSQPALSAQMKQIEEGLGIALFKRSHAGTELTSRGRAFLISARKMLQQRTEAVRAISPMLWPLRLGYSPFINHELVEEALTGYRELVPEGRISSTCEFSAALMKMIDNEQLDAGIVSLPVESKGLSVHQICEEKILLCMRRDDAYANAEVLPKELIAEKLRIMFAPAHHPRFYEKILRKFRKAGIELQPTEFASGPANMQFLVKTDGCYALIREGTPLDPQLRTREIPNVSLWVQTALVFKIEQQRPVLSLLAYRMQKLCAGKMAARTMKRPPTSVGINGATLRRVAS
jgi:DNA-binding transcriptional LysR family regulator